jgi:hypothetical protein
MTRSARLLAKVRQLEECRYEPGELIDPMGEARILRAFIEDMRLGIRDLSEYKEFCAREGVWAPCSHARRGETAPGPSLPGRCSAF